MKATISKESTAAIVKLSDICQTEKSCSLAHMEPTFQQIFIEHLPGIMDTMISKNEPRLPS